MLIPNPDRVKITAANLVGIALCIVGLWLINRK
jgi:hypothetical protein